MSTGLIHLPSISESVKHEPVPTRSVSAPLKKQTEAETIQLTDEVNRIEDLDQIAKAIELIKRLKPELAANCEELKIAVGKLWTCVTSNVTFDCERLVWSKQRQRLPSKLHKLGPSVCRQKADPVGFKTFK
jgi:hypothetical protein